MSLIADALKLAQDQRRAETETDGKARRLLTPAGPLRIQTGRPPDMPRSLALAGAGLAGAVLVLGAVVAFSPRTEVATAASAPATPLPASRDVALPDLGGEVIRLAGGSAGAAAGIDRTTLVPVPAATTGDAARRGPAAGGGAGVGARTAGAAPPPATPSSFRLSLRGQPPADLFARALAAQQGGELELAAELYRRALGVRPDDPEIHNNLGTVYRALGEPEEALGAFERAVAADAAYAPAWNNLGVAMDAVGRGDEAVAMYREALRLDPGNAGARVNLSNRYHEQGLIPDAMRLVREAVRDDPSLPEAHYAMARLLETTGDGAGAVRHYTLFLNTAGGRFPALEVLVRDHVRSLGGG